MYEVYERVGVPFNDIRKGFQLYLICLVGIFVLNVYWWIMLVLKIVKEIRGGEGEKKVNEKPKEKPKEKRLTRSRSRSKAKKV